MTLTKKRVLLVEDDPQLLRLIEKFLIAEKLDVITAVCINEGAEQVRSLHSLELAIVDFWLDQADATELLDTLQDRFPGTPILVITGGNQTTPIETAHAVAQVSGAVSFLQKPFSRTVLVDEVERLLRE